MIGYTVFFISNFDLKSYGGEMQGISTTRRVTRVKRPMAEMCFYLRKTNESSVDGWRYSFKA